MNLSMIQLNCFCNPKIALCEACSYLLSWATDANIRVLNVHTFLRVMLTSLNTLKNHGLGVYGSTHCLKDNFESTSQLYANRVGEMCANTNIVINSA